MTHVVEAPGTAEDILQTALTPPAAAHPRPAAPHAGAQPAHRPGPRVHRVRAGQRPVLPARRTSRSSCSRSAVVGSLAVGQTLIILTAGIDLSIGAVMVLAVAGHGQARLRQRHARRPGPARRHRRRRRCAGTLNGLLVTRIKLPPFIVTLGTLSIFTAITLHLRPGPDDHSRARTRSSPGPARPISIGSFNITIGVLMMLRALRRCSPTPCGRPRGAGTSTPPATTPRRPGWPASGPTACCCAPTSSPARSSAIAAWILIGRVDGGDPNAGLNANLESITAVVIGGTSLFGGRGAVIGSLIGALIVQVFDNGLALAGVDPNYQVLAVGVLVIVAVAVDQWIRSVKS